MADILKDANPEMDDIADVAKAFGNKINGTLKAIDAASAATLGAMP